MVKKIPMRTCVMCKAKKDKRDLLRIVRTPDGKLEFDPTGKKNGRGVYLCTDDACVDNIKNRKKISSALDIEPSQEELQSVIDTIKAYLMNKK
jgi:predicted RNA-binding protein YlxR (DUF448 family)